MVKSTLVLKDKAFRIVVPEAVRIAEEINLGDVIEVDIIKIEPGRTINKSKRNVGRPKKYSDTPCSECGHYEDIHEMDAYGKWTGKCLHSNCDCTGFIAPR